MPCEPASLYAAEIEARTALGDRPGLAEANYGISFTYSVLDLSNPETAEYSRRYITAALEIYQELGDDAGLGRCEWALANVLWGTMNTCRGAGACAFMLSSCSRRPATSS